MFNALFTKTEEYAKLAQALGGPGACALFGIPGAGRALVYFPRHWTGRSAS